MNYRDKTIEELLTELHELQQNYNSVVDLLEKNEGLKILIEELKCTIDELNITHEKYCSLYNNTPALLYSLDSNRSIIGVSEYWLKKLGYTREEVLGKQITDFIPESFHARIVDLVFPELTANGFSDNIEIQFIKRNNEIIDTLLSSVVEYEKGSSIPRYLSVLTDITVKKAMEEGLRKSEGIFRTVLSSANDGIIYQEKEGKILTWNKKAEEVFGIKAEDVVNKSSLSMDWRTYKEDGSLFSGEENPSIITLKTGRPCRDIVMKIIRPDKEYSWINMNTNPVFKEDLITPEAVVITFSDITERKESENKMEALTLLNRQIIQNVQEGIVVYDCDLKYLVWNPYMEKITGISASNVIGKHPLEVFPFLEEIGIMDILKNALQGGEPSEKEILYTIPETGKSGWAAETSVPLRNTSEEIIGVIGTVRDITTRKQTELSLLLKNDELLISKEIAEESEAYNRLIFDLSPIGLALCRMDGSIMDVNLAYAKILGRSIQETLNLTYWDITPQIYMSVEIEQLNNLKEKGVFGPFEKDYIHKDGSLVPVRLQGTVFTRKGEQLILTAVEDISERKQAEKALFLSEEKYRLIAKNTSDVIWVMNLESKKLTYISPSVTNLTGYSPEEAMQQSIYDAFTPESVDLLFNDINADIENYYLNNKSKSTNIHEMRQICKDGSLVWVEISITLIISDENKIGEIVGVTRNIENRKKVEIQIQRKNTELIELNNTKDKFFSIIAHDLKSPFTSILGLSEMLVENGDSYNIDEIKELSSFIYTSAKKTFKLLENLLEWSKIQRGMIVPKFQDCLFRSITDEIDFLWKDSAKIKNITINNDVAQELMVYCDVEMVKTILRNLVSNAIKFTQKNGTVSINAIPRDMHIEVQVRDNGIGISEENIQNLFKIETSISTPGTSNESGTGLGLLLCNDLIKRQGGKIWVESEIGIGTVFCFTIPNKQQSIGLIENLLTVEDLSQFTILVAEDEDINYHLINKLLAGFKIKTIHAKNGQEAIEVTEKNPNIDLILMDVRMPILDGNEATKVIKRLKPEIPIIIQTAFVQDTDITRAFDAGCNDYIQKPINKDKLKSILIKYLFIEK